jgi:hypothetical protein
MKLLALLPVVLAVAASTAAGAVGPRVTLDGLSPVVVYGAGFGHAVPVRVTVVAGDTRLVKVVGSTATGSFQAVWRTTLRPGRCVPVGVTAVSGTERATMKTAISKTCGPPPITP